MPGPNVSRKSCVYFFKNELSTCKQLYCLVLQMQGPRHNHQNAPLAIRSNSSCLLGLLLQTGARAVGSPFITHNALVQFALPDVISQANFRNFSLAWNLPRPPSIPSSAKILPHTHLSYTSGSCLTLNKRRGPMILTLQTSHTLCIITRRPISQEFSLARLSMVHARHPSPHVRLSVLTSFVWFILGIIIVLFFRCMVALLDPVHRRGERVKWGLVSYTMVMFSLVTIGNAVYPYLESISYIDNREFSGIEGVVGPGPLAYQMFVAPIVLQIIPNVSFTLSNWLADGLLVSSLCDLHSLIHVSNIGSSSSIVVTLSTPRTSGSSPSPVSCTLVRLVRVFEFSTWCQHYGLTSST